jgi:ATP-dependent Clp protease ATP-binding subunit ClpC
MDDALAWIIEELRGPRGNDARALGARIAREWASLRPRASELEQYDDPRVRVALAYALGRMEREENDETLLVRLMSDPSEDVASAAVAAFRKGYPPAVADALRAIVMGDRVFAMHVRALSEVRAQTDEPLLRSLVGSIDAEIGKAAIVALGRMPVLDAASLAVLIEAMTTDATRNIAADALSTQILRHGAHAIRETLTPDASEMLVRVTARADPKVAATLRLVHPPVAPVAPVAPVSRPAVDPFAALKSFGHLLARDDRRHAHREGGDETVREIAAMLEGERDGRTGPRKSVLVVGPPQIGKTNLIHAVARELGTRGFSVLESSWAEVFVGTKWQGEWETRLKTLIDLVRAPAKIVLYMTDMHALASLGRNVHRNTGFAEEIAPYLERGELALIGEASDDNLRAGAQRSEILRRGFERVRLREPGPEETKNILRARLRDRAERDAIPYSASDQTLDDLLDLARVVAPAAARPGASVALLEQVVAAKSERAKLEPSASAAIDASEVVLALSRSTGLPAALLDDRIAFDAAQTRAFFEDRVLGQPEAVDVVVELATLVKAGLTDPDRPIGSLFFVGPTGVGKTEIAKSLAEYLYGSPDRMVRFDMSEFRDWESYERLIGSARNGTEGLLTKKIEDQPFSVVLLDEIEKAHANVHDLLLQILDDGRLTDARGVSVDMRRCVVIMTSNLGSKIDVDVIGFGADGDSAPSQDAVLRILRKSFRPELINRFGRIVVFRPLTPEILRTLVRRELGKAALRSGVVRRRVVLDLAPELVDLLASEGFSIAYGARPLKRRVERRVLLPIAHALVKLGSDSHGTVLRVEAKDGEVVVRVVTPRAPAPTTMPHAASAPITRETASARIGALMDRVAAIARSPERENERRLRGELLEHTRAVTFWDEPVRARADMIELADLDERLGALEQIDKRLEGAAELVRDFLERDASLRVRVDHVLKEIEPAVDELEHRFLAEQREDRADVFFTIKRIGGAKDDAAFVEELALMYERWAEAHEVTSALIDEQVDARGFVHRTWYWEGSALFGKLRAEAGLHRYEHGGRGKERRASLAEVIVWPVPPHAPAVRIARSQRRGKWKIAIDGGALELTCRHDLPDTIVQSYRAASSLSSTAPRRDDVIRRYGVEGRYAVDSDTGQRFREKDFASSGLDEIVAARVRARLEKLRVATGG